MKKSEQAIERLTEREAKDMLLKAKKHVARLSLALGQVSKQVTFNLLPDDPVARQAALEELREPLQLSSDEIDYLMQTLGSLRENLR